MTIAPARAVPSASSTGCISVVEVQSGARAKKRSGRSGAGGDSLPAAVKRKLKERRKRNTTWIVSEKYAPALPRPGVINHFGCSGGKDSTALLLWAVHESGYPRESLDVSFCDTGNESPLTYDYIRYLEDALQVAITWIRPELGFYDLAKSKKRFPSARARFCTEELKIIPTTDYINSLRSQCRELFLHSGVRALESAARAELPPESYDARFGAWVRRPLLNKTVSEIWEMHDRYGIKPNPLYKLGHRRVGCRLCCMSRKDDVRKVAKHQPEAIDVVRAAERDSLTWPRKCTGQASFFHASVVPKIQRTGDFVSSKGKASKIATIDDVVRWSQTDRGGVQGNFDPDDFASIAGVEKLPMGESARSCPSSLGMCE